MKGIAMNKKTAIISVVALLAVGYSYFTVLGSEVALFERFPEIDPKIVVKAHRIMLRRAVTGQYNEHGESDEDHDRIFLDIVNELQK